MLINFKKSLQRIGVYFTVIAVVSVTLPNVGIGAECPTQQVATRGILPRLASALFLITAVTFPLPCFSSNPYFKHNEWTEITSNWGNQVWDYCTDIYKKHSVKYDYPLGSWSNIYKCTDEKVLTYYQEAIDAGGKPGIVAKYRLVDSERRKQGLSAKYLSVLEETASAGYDDPQYDLGILLIKGNGVKQDIGRGIKLIQLAADQGHFGAMHEMMRQYLKGEYVKPSEELALMWATKYRQGSLTAAYESLADLCEQDASIPMNEVRAKKWHAMAPKQSSSLRGLA